VPGESDHLAVLCATRIGTPRREIKKDVGCGDKERVREENLRVGGRLVGKEHYERRASLVKDRTEDEIDLGEARRPSLMLQCMLKMRI
jgi:hypothetical protein